MCNEYRVDVAGANFGDCKCGFPKSAHAESAMKGDRRGERQEDDGTLNATVMQPGYGVPGLMGTPMDQYGLMGQMGRGAGAGRMQQGQRGGPGGQMRGGKGGPDMQGVMQGM